MDIEKKIEYWKKSAEHDLDTAQSLIKEKRYDWALFLGHLVLEKILKAHFVKKKGIFPPRTHNLILLIKANEIKISEEEYNFFEEVNSFNISVRYPDEQFKFYEFCSKEYVEEMFSKIKGKFECLRKKLK